MAENSGVHVGHATMTFRAAPLIAVLVCVLLTAVTYALGLGVLLPPRYSGARQLPEYALLVLLGVSMLVVARQARRSSRVGPRPSAVRLSSPSANGFAANLISARAAVK